MIANTAKRIWELFTLRFVARSTSVVFVCFVVFEIFPFMFHSLI